MMKKYKIALMTCLFSTRAVPGSPDMLDMFRRMGKKVIYVTNNGIVPTETNVEKLNSLGYAAEKVQYFESESKIFPYSKSLKLGLLF